MLWILLLLALGLVAVWSGVDSRDRSEISEEELLAHYGMTWEQNDPLASGQATELAAALMARRSYTILPARYVAPVSTKD